MGGSKESVAYTAMLVMVVNGIVRRPGSETQLWNMTF